MGHVEDRWTRPGPDGKRIRTERWGKGKRWRAVWTEPTGERKRQACDTKDEATAVVAKAATSIREGTYVPPDRGRITLADAAELWFAQQLHLRPSTRAAVRNRLDKTILPTLGHVRLAHLDRETVQLAVKQWTESLAPATVRVAYTYLAGILTTAVADRRIPVSPCHRIRLPEVDREPVVPLSLELVQRIINNLWVPFRPLGVFIAATGMRSGEARGLTWDRVALTGDGATVRIDRQLVKTGPVFGPLKTPSSIRRVSIGPATLEALGTPGEGLVFPGRGRGISRSLAGQAWKAATEGLGLPERSGWHDLRHFHASLLIADGVSPVAVAHRLGHKDATETLRTYAHLWPDDEQRMRDAADGLVHLPTP